MAAFTDNIDVPNAPVTYYTVVNSPLDVTKNAVYCAVTLVSDALIVYRLFAVWGHNYYITILPMLAFFADIGTSVWFLSSLRLVTPDDDVLLSKVTVRSKYFYTVTLVLNILCTCGISCKIWMIQRGLSEYAMNSVSRLRRILSIIIESGASHIGIDEIKLLLKLFVFFYQLQFIQLG
ncbi:hypothetical protein EIP86_001876 [Pleurotus ostreatoroseus]|nr:hypothetical protein EIP86_001876 [Pleurotus ostreatoroseus]